jgi:heme oxygenase
MIYIYDRLESLASKAGLLEGLDGLERTKRIAEDLKELDSNYESILTDSTFSYLAYLDKLYKSDRKNDLFAHIYVRHLGDMYGGKLISRVVPGSGKWYQFDNRPELVKAFNNKLSLDHADEALVAFGHFENIFNDLWLKIHK